MSLTNFELSRLTASKLTFRSQLNANGTTNNGASIIVHGLEQGAADNLRNDTARTRNIPSTLPETQ